MVSSIEQRCAHLVPHGAAGGPCDHDRVSYPSYPTPATPGSGGVQLGLYPLRPLRVGELIGAALRVAWRHLAVLAPIALVLGLIGSVANLLVLAGNGALRSYASGDYAKLPVDATPAQVQAMVSNLFSHILPGVAIGSLIGLVSAPVLAGLATPFAALGATSGVATNGAGLARLRGRLPVLIGLALLVSVLMAVGLVLLVVPGIIVWLMFLLSTPVAAMEGSSLGASLRRARALSKGFRGRLLGVSLLIGLIVGVIAVVVSLLIGKIVSTADPLQHLFITQAASVLASAILAPWSACVVAMLYVDIRMRREGLADALLAASRPSPYS